MPDDVNDLDVLDGDIDADPPSLDLPSADDFVAQEGSVEPVADADAGTVTDLGWELCLRYNGKPWQKLIFQADSAAQAAGWATAYTSFANRMLVNAGFPPLATWSAGACP